MQKKDKEISAKEFEEFLTLLGKLTEAEFLGVARMLNTSFADENGDPKPFDVLLEHVMDEFCSISRHSRRLLIKLMKINIRHHKDGDKHAAKHS